MNNKFDRSNYPEQEPETLVVGDRWAWRRDDLANIYDPSLYSLTYRFQHDSGGSGNSFTITATESNDNYFIEVDSSVTANYSVSEYKWDAYITRTSDSERVRVDFGRTKLVENLATSTADLRSHAKKVLDAIEAVIENRASMDQSSMSIAGRSLSRMTIDELLVFRDRYNAEYLREVKRDRVRNKKPSGNEILVSFGTKTYYDNITDLK